MANGQVDFHPKWLIDLTSAAEPDKLDNLMLLSIDVKSIIVFVQIFEVADDILISFLTEIFVEPVDRLKLFFGLLKHLSRAMALEILDLATIVSSRLVNDAAVAIRLPICKLTLNQNTMVDVEHLADAMRLIVDHLPVI